MEYAAQKGLSAFALTDHDTIAGLDAAIHYAKEQSNLGRKMPEVIPGIEFSTEYLGKDVHIVGLYIHYHAPEFQKTLQEFVNSRIARNHKMCQKLTQAGVPVRYEDLLQRFPNSVITRAHYATYMLEQGYIKSLNEAFDRYIGDRCSCFVPREKVTPFQAISLILEAGGIPVLAHPLLYHLSNTSLETLVCRCKDAGLVAIEAIYATHSTGDERQLRKLATKYDLLISGGSDFHGDAKPGLDLGTGYGKLVIPEDILYKLKRTQSKLLFTDMDGTLLNSQNQISPALKHALDAMTRAGHHLILSSGRPLPSILEVRSHLGIDYPNMLIISNNGALVYDCDTHTNILVHRLPIEDIRFIIGEAETQGLHIHAYTDSEIVCHGMNDELRYYTSRVHLPLKCVKNIPDALPEGSFKLQVIHLTNRTALENFRTHIQTALGDRVQMIFSNDQYLEILPPKASKGNALLFVENHLHIPHSHTYAAGDAENDISMLEAASTAIAMANAPAIVRKKAHRITQKDNNHDGLLEILQDCFL